MRNYKNTIAWISVSCSFESLKRDPTILIYRVLFEGYNNLKGFRKFLNFCVVCVLKDLHVQQIWKHNLPENTGKLVSYDYWNTPCISVINSMRTINQNIFETPWCLLHTAVIFPFPQYKSLYSWKILFCIASIVIMVFGNFQFIYPIFYYWWIKKCLTN